ncbi:hypothetical protein A2W14_01895 [Candidatus Gottesmanbacteria bacterium RBG_16_37_8]|uniref:PrgI family protein n=1 Tax=Candidatus Gottesmanbacteria bacterium RBG_16_37_8 TaxID=1798371 RepID=A0A1F5YPR8_9BACT|nr:MAG: hypothetical protein A2W14_01895 [Candidatus Gottesmanbacteria bacterium RBG_16_37_8]
MEQHPVPRNISSFQFRLVGDMTMRQFLYLAGGAAIAFLLFKFSPFPAIIKWPIVLFFAFGGIAFAFLPIADRPLDRWLMAFIKSINSPTQYIWHKNTVIPDILLRNYTSPIKKLPQNHQEAHQDAKKKLDLYLQNLPKQPHQELNIREKHYVDRTLLLFTQTGQSQGGQIMQPGFIPTKDPIGQIPAMRPDKIDVGKVITPPEKIIMPGIIADDKVVEEKRVIEQTIKPIEAGQIKTPTVPIPLMKAAGQTEPELPPEKKEAAEKPTETVAIKKEGEKLAEIIKEKEKLEKELQKFKDEMSKSGKLDYAKATTSKPDIIKPQLAPEKQAPTIKTVTAKTAVNEIGIPRFPQVPNIIMGVIKDMQGKILPNIILTVKDTKGTPHRALKTNRLGQFSTATPLQNGIYHIEAEDPLKRYVFDIAEINLTGKVFLPIEITAKGEKELMREKLTKEIFGSQGATI